MQKRSVGSIPKNKNGITSTVNTKQGQEMQTQDVESLPIGQRRLTALKTLCERLRTGDTLDALRTASGEDMLSGTSTLKDLFRLNCSLNGKPIPLTTPPDVRVLASGISEEERESSFSLQKLCKQMRITEQQYRDIDKYGYRRDIFFALLLLFRNAQAHENGGNLHVPNMLLLEELVTTLNQELFFFPHTYLIASEGYALESLIDDSNEELWSGKFSPTGDITITCPAPNKISVFVKVKFPAWLGTTTGVESQLSYDVEVIDDEFISYQNIRTTFLFQGTNRRLFDKTCREFRKNPGRSHHFQLDPPNIFPEKEGLIMDAQLEGGAFTIQSMLSPVLEKVTLPSDIQQPSATISPEKSRSAWHTIEDLLGHIGRCIQNFYVAAKNLFCCCIAGKAKTLPQDYDDVANTVHKKSTERNTREEASVNTNKPSALQQAADTAPALITADARPDGHASSVNVGPAIEDNTASRNCELR